MNNKKILVVDDDPMVLQCCKRVLELEDHLVVCRAPTMPSITWKWVTSTS